MTQPTHWFHNNSSVFVQRPLVKPVSLVNIVNKMTFIPPHHPPSHPPPSPPPQGVTIICLFVRDHNFTYKLFVKVRKSVLIYFATKTQLIQSKKNFVLSMEVIHSKFVSVTDSLCLSQNISVCHSLRQSVSVRDSMCLSPTICVCHRQSVFVTCSLFLSHTCHS